MTLNFFSDFPRSAGAINNNYLGIITFLRFTLLLFTLNYTLFAEPAILSGEQVASARHDAGILWQWFCIALRRRQTSDPEEVKCHHSVFKVIMTAVFI